MTGSVFIQLWPQSEMKSKGSSHGNLVIADLGMVVNDAAAEQQDNDSELEARLPSLNSIDDLPMEALLGNNRRAVCGIESVHKLLVSILSPHPLSLSFSLCESDV